MNVCVVGYGMTGTWHTEALKTVDCCLHTLVGRRPEAAAEFAARYGYQKWTIDLEEALNDDTVDVVILANPSELHAATAIASLEHGKATLVEIPIAMSLPDAERVVAVAQEHNVPLGVMHPTRVQPEFVALRQRVIDGTEQVRHIGGRFFIYRLTNEGASGYKRSWTDNLLWHHINHLVDFGLWMLGETTQTIHSFMPPPDPKTGIPMDVFFGAETGANQSLICTGSYYGRERIFENLVVTDKESYRLDSVRDIMTLGSNGQHPASWTENNYRVTRDFVEAVQKGRQPAITGESVLPAMRALQVAQDQWDRLYGEQELPGRPLNQLNYRWKRR